MKRFINRYAVLALAGALFFGGCKDDHFLAGGEYIPALNSATLAPATNASGTQRAYIGTEVSVQGFNLDRLTTVTVAGVQAEITAQSIKELKFKIPFLELVQRDLPHEVEIKAFGAKEEQFFTYAYYVTVPVTDASVSGYAPAEGTVGTEVTLSGRNLGQITRIRFGSATVEAADFTAVDEAGDFVKFRVPAGSYGAPDVEVAIAAEWGTETIDVTGEALFWVHVPAIVAPEQAEGTNSAVGDELMLTGRNLDLVKAVKWGETALVIVAQSSEALKVRFPSSITQADPAVQAKPLVAEWGLTEPAQTAPLAEAWRVDTTPSSTVITPEFGQMTVEDGKFYLGKTVTVPGANLTAVEGVELQYGSERVEAEVLAGATDSELKFTVPDGVTFDTATEVSVVALYNGGEQLEIGKATVYPFYYFKGIRLGLGSAVSTYSEFAAENAFFYPDLGRVVSTGEFVADQLDPYVFVDGGNPAVTSNKINKSVMPDAADYYAVKPYIYVRATSKAFGFAGCANTDSQLKTHCYWYNNKWTALPTTCGTPIVFYRIATGSTAFTNLAAAVKGATITTMSDYSLTIPGTAAPNFGWTESSSAWTKGSVLVCAYVTYEKGDKPADTKTDIAKLGYIYVTDVTCANTGDDKALDDRSGYVEFDMFWSKTLNE